MLGQASGREGWLGCSFSTVPTSRHGRRGSGLVLRPRAKVFSVPVGPYFPSKRGTVFPP